MIVVSTFSVVKRLGLLFLLFSDYMNKEAITMIDDLRTFWPSIDWMKYRFSFWTSRFVVFIFSLRDVLRMDWVRVEAERVLRTRGCPSCILCSLSSRSLSLMSGSSQMSKGVSPLRVRAFMFAPFCANNSTTSKWPQQAAAWRGCQRSSSTTSVDAWWSSRNSTTDK